ncbi:Asp23/Gls24 family envelope stress response protein [Nonomuraea sp. NPDC050153]|uniref:Asp23/Gls24 family envelope stress response protein n=1 Tax=Nonomuraea sp. NPDC050153 TaxID=3364359 RepID=UPI003794CA51
MIAATGTGAVAGSVAGTGAVPVLRPAPPPPEMRGRTRIAGRVVAKIACCAAEELPEVLRVRPGGTSRSRRPDAEVRGEQATVHLNVSVAYPSPLRAVAARLRQHVIARVAAQTGLNVTRLDVTMTGFGGDLP